MARPVKAVKLRRRCVHCLKRPKKMVGNLCPTCNGIAMTITATWRAINEREKRINQAPAILARVCRVGSGRVAREFEE